MKNVGSAILTSIATWCILVMWNNDYHLWFTIPAYIFVMIMIIKGIVDDKPKAQ